ncbi:MAG: hypothetical protein IPK58_05055 [Acidobacteria bacterium]|nr:hypothetical protein [Acidobacteriota bacterium]
MIIHSSAPTRVDLAGGTIDIPPLFLFHEGAATVNFAVSLLAHCRIETRNDDKIVLGSLDRGVQFETTLGAIDSLKNEPRLELLAKLVYFFKPTVGFNMITESQAPAAPDLPGHRLSTSPVSARSTNWSAIATRLIVSSDRGGGRMSGDQGPDGISGLLLGSVRWRFVHTFRTRRNAARSSRH